MTFTIAKRSLVRIVSFLLAFIVAISVYAVITARQSGLASRTLEYHYMKSVEDLITYTQNINSDLSKALYIKSPEMMSQISSKIWRESGFAKDIISTLPIEYTKLQNTNKLLSQVGDYCVSLSKAASRGEPITKEQRDTLISLAKYCDTMTRETMAVGDAVRTGSLNLASVQNKVKDEFKEQKVAGIGDGFAELEEGFTAYPTLIYDGPFSDHIMQKQPERLKNEKTVGKEVALEKASLATGVAMGTLKTEQDEKSKIESYCFSAEGVNISITKKGGLIASMLKSRDVGEAKLTPKLAIKKADEYLAKLHVESMAVTYYEIANNIMTINYAYKTDNVLVYTDLIKVSVALDNGEICGFDARGFIVNHKPREMKKPIYSSEQASASVSDYLTIESAQLCIVPSGGLSEALCYEFKCKSDDGKDLLVYINANTKREEQILLLLVSENGTLTI